MGRAGRFACIFLPLCATAATAVIIILSVFIGQTNKGNGLANSMYFIRLDTRNIDTNSTIDLVKGTNADNVIAGLTHLDTSIGGAAKLIGLPDFYQAGFWGYCSGTVDNATNSFNVQNCSKSTGFFTFDIIDIINKEVTTGQNLTFPAAVTDAFKAVHALSRVQYIAFIVGIIATLIEFAVGWFGLFSRIGSCVTTLVANIAFIALLGGAVVNIVLYKSMEGAFNKTYGQFGIKATTLSHVYNLMFIGVALSLGAAIFWLFSSCCCSGRRDRIVKQKDVGEKRSGKSGSYERVGSPYSNSQPFLPNDPSHGQQTYGQTSYEPMRHQPV